MHYSNSPSFAQKSEVTPKFFSCKNTTGGSRQIQPLKGKPLFFQKFKNTSEFAKNISHALFESP